MTTEGTTPAKPKIGGLNPKAQKLQAMREKLEAQKNGGSKQSFSSGNTNTKGNTAAGHKKTNFQRKAT
ncbi:MAG: hypothetical protein ACRYF4_07325 [Janthinobacterium lividum]